MRITEIIGHIMWYIMQIRFWQGGRFVRFPGFHIRDQLVEFRGYHRIQAGRGLVEEEDLRVESRGARERGACGYRTGARGGRGDASDRGGEGVVSRSIMRAAVSEGCRASVRGKSA